MRILLTSDSVGGVWDYAATLAGELRAGGHDVLLAVIGDPSPGRLASLPPRVEVEARAFRLEWMPEAAGEVEAAGRWLESLARSWCAEVVHLNQFAYATRDFGAPTLVVAHSDVLSWFEQTLSDAPGPEWGRYVGWVKAGLEAADVVVAPSAYQAALTERHYGRTVDRVIHNGATRPLRASGPRDRMALTAGRAWDAAKGVEVVNAAARMLRESGPPIHLFGEDTLLAGGSARTEHLVRHGQIPHAELVDWMGRASLYVAASRYEPFGLAPLEAALEGCALVLSDIGSFRELWDGCAAFFPSGNAAALAATLSRLDRDPARRAELARAARERAAERYTAERCAAEYIELYQQLTGRLLTTRVGAGTAQAHRHFRVRGNPG
jgi:glycosyltransferase involved in cell wall biosynthesis